MSPRESNYRNLTRTRWLDTAVCPFCTESNRAPRSDVITLNEDGTAVCGNGLHFIDVGEDVCACRRERAASAPVETAAQAYARLALHDDDPFSEAVARAFAAGVAWQKGLG